MNPLECIPSKTVSRGIARMRVKSSEYVDVDLVSEMARTTPQAVAPVARRFRHRFHRLDTLDVVEGKIAGRQD